jgi:2-phospho-L-lactate guanylyltransferase
MDATWAVVPVKDFSRAKTRLSPVLDPAARANLARELFDHVLDVLGACSGLSGTLVATDSDLVASLAAHRGAYVTRDSGAPALGHVVDEALVAVARAGARSALVLMSDLPAIRPREIDELLAAHATHDVVAAPDRHQRQTNALVLRLPARAPTRFGLAGSYELHRADALSYGLSFAAVRASRLALDLDEPEDLVLWRHAEHTLKPASARIARE